MRTSTAFFAGAGTVVVAIAAGLGGGLVLANLVNPHSPKQEMTKLERRMSPEPIPVSNAPSEPVPYLAATQAATAATDAAIPAQNQQQIQPAEATASNTAANGQPAASAPQSAAPGTQAAAPEQSKTSEPSRTPEDAFANARDADVKREARRAEERRRAERRQQWSDKRRYQQRQDQELRDVEQKVREDTGSPRIFAAEPVRIEVPRIRLFGEDDD
ncbi:MAG: hypothetical protein ACJ8EE_10390 [Bradyrhizobium sp.]